MNKITNSDSDNDSPTSITDRLPSLSEKETRIALLEDNLEWARQLLASLLGKVHQSNGVYLQRVSESEVRCVGLVDHYHAWESLSSMKATLSAEGASMQMEPYTILIPYTEEEEESVDSHEEPTGMEIV